MLISNTMTLEQKKLVVREICARMPYGIRVQFGKNSTYTPIVTEIDFGNGFIMSSAADPYMILRNLSSMTEEEKDEYFKVCDKDLNIAADAMDASSIIEDNQGNHSSGFILTNELEFMYKHHFDFPRPQEDGSYKTLTQLGLAIEDKDNSAYKNYKQW